jgi:gas vesicle protein
MGYLAGVVTGVLAAAAAAAWYMSRSGQDVRDQLQLEKKLGELGDEVDRRSRDIQAQVNAQIAEMRKDQNGHDAATDVLDDAKASAAEAAAGVEAQVGKAVKDAG